MQLLLSMHIVQERYGVLAGFSCQDLLAAQMHVVNLVQAETHTKDN